MAHTPPPSPPILDNQVSPSLARVEQLLGRYQHLLSRPVLRGIVQAANEHLAALAALDAVDPKLAEVLRRCLAPTGNRLAAALERAGVLAVGPGQRQ